MLKRLAIAMVILGAMFANSYGEVLHVGTGQDYGSIQSAIDAAVEGDTVLVHQGVYDEQIALTGANIIVQSEDPMDQGIVDNTVLQGVWYEHGSIVTFEGREDASCVLSGFTIINGNQLGDGGGINGNGTEATISYCVLADNLADNGGGISGCHGLISHCMLVNNWAMLNGGGIDNCNGRIEDCLIVLNSSEQFGGGVSYSNAVIVNCTIADNFAVWNGGGLSECPSSVITNSIIWNNDPSPFYNTSIPSYSCYNEAYYNPGTQTIWYDPQFMPNSYELSYYSPCVDMGNSNAVSSTVDLAGMDRILDGDRLNGAAVDMGAYETYVSVPLFEVSDVAVDFIVRNVDEPVESQIIGLRNRGAGTLNWEITGAADWLTLSSTSGSNDGEVEIITLDVEVEELDFGYYSCDLVISDPAADNNPWVVTVTLSVSQGVLHVPASFATIQDAIDACVDGDEVVVAPGRYDENINFMGKDILVRSSDPDNWGVVEDTVIYGQGGASVVTFNMGEDHAEIRGFTITAGSGYGEYQGGGVYVGYNAYAIIRQNIIENNYIVNGYGYGGGVYCYYEGEIIGNIIRNNYIINVQDDLEGRGGGVYAVYNVLVKDNVISNNGAYYDGGVYSDNSKFIGNTISGNFSYRYGVGTSYSGQWYGNTISNNQAADYCGGIYASSSQFSHNLIAYNTTDGSYGGGRFSNCKVINNTYVYNSSDYAGHGSFSQSEIINNIFVGATGYGLSVSNCFLKNNDFWANSPGHFTNSSLQVIGTKGNVSFNPEFIDDSFHISQSSGCYNSGVNLEIESEEVLDIDGQWVAMGAYREIGCDEVLENAQPIAVMTEYQYFGETGQTVDISGELSTDRDGDSLSYHWRQVSGPTVEFDDSATVITFTAGETPAIYGFELIVNDGHYDSLPVRGVVVSGNRAPIANAGEDRTVAIVNEIILSGNRSYDLDESASVLRYEWKQVGGPRVNLINSNQMECSFESMVEGVYEFELIVSDGDLFSDPDRVRITISQGQFVTSDNPGGAVYDWIDISGSGAEITGMSDEVDLGPFDIGFDFPFYGNHYDEFYFSDNGVITFDDIHVSFSELPLPIPQIDNVNNMIAWLMQDLVPASGSQGVSNIYYEYLEDMGCLVIQINNYRFFSDSAPRLDVEIILYRSGKIKIQYQSVSGVYSSLCTVGVENANGTEGIQVTYNEPFLHDGLAIEFFREVNPSGLPVYNETQGAYFHTISSALESANENDVVVVSPGVYVEPLVIGRNVTLVSTNPNDPDIVERTVIDGGQDGSVITLAEGLDESCVISGFTIQQGDSDSKGGGILGNGCQATIDHCIFYNNSAAIVGGAIFGCNGMIRNCMFRENNAQWGSGIVDCGGLIVNCVFVNNAGDKGGSAISNCDGDILYCTIVNHESSDGGVIDYCDGMVQNCIIWNNNDESFNECTATIAATCYPEATGDNSTIAVDPEFISQYSYELTSGSMCIDAGILYETVDTDFNGTPRVIDGNGDEVAIPDMGAYEYSPLGVLNAQLTQRNTSFMYGINSDFHDRIAIRNPGDEAIEWSVSSSDDWLVVSPATGEVGARGYNECIINYDTDELSSGKYTGTIVLQAPDSLNGSVSFEVSIYVGYMRYVPSLSYPNIQDAINESVDGDTVVVAEGRYEELLTLRGKNLLIRSEYPLNKTVVRQTIIDGNGMGSVVTLSGSETSVCELSGLTIRGGYGGSKSGGIVGNYSNATIRHCIIEDNVTDVTGGGINKLWGRIDSCLIQNNKAMYGGGVGTSHGRIENTIFVGNEAHSASALADCDGEIYNCTFSGNVAVLDGALGYCDGFFYNCIEWGNSSSQFTGMGAEFTNCCMSSEQFGSGNFVSDPGFVMPGDFHLRDDSPCIDAGSHFILSGLSETDHDGLARVVAGPGQSEAEVDIGAYEYHAESALMVLSTHHIEVVANDSTSMPEPVELVISKTGGSAISWSVENNVDWLEVSPMSGTVSGDQSVLTIQVDSRDFDYGVYTDAITIHSDDGLNTSAEVTVEVHKNVIHVPTDFETIQEAINEAVSGSTLIIAPGVYAENLNSIDKDLTFTSIDPSDPCIVETTVIEGFEEGSVLLTTGSTVVIKGITLQGGGLLKSPIRDMILKLDFDQRYTDQSVLQQQIALQGQPGFSMDSARGSHALLLDGQNGLTTSSIENDFTKPFSVSVWFNIKGFINEANPLVVCGLMNPWGIVHVDDGTFEDNLIFFCFNKNNDAYIAVGHTPVDDGEWHHAVGVYTGGRIQLYIDGVLQHDLAAPEGLVLRPNEIGIGNFNVAGAVAEAGLTGWDGMIDDVRIYKRALSSVEVSQLNEGTFSKANGGGLAVYGCDVTLDRCRLIDNIGNKGGGAYGENSEFRTMDSLFMNNSADLTGGGISLVDSVARIRNSLIAENSALWGGGISVEDQSDVLVDQATITANSGDQFCGGLLAFNGNTVDVRSSILWGNISATGHELAVGSASNPSTVNVSFSDLQGGVEEAYIESGNSVNLITDVIDVDPGFVVSEPPYQLGVGSPCIDGGDYGSAWEQEPVPNGNRANMGAYGNTPLAAISPAVLQGSTFVLIPEMVELFGDGQSRYAMSLMISNTSDAAVETVSVQIVDLPGGVFVGVDDMITIDGINAMETVNSVDCCGDVFVIDLSREDLEETGRMVMRVDYTSQGEAVTQYMSVETSMRALIGEELAGDIVANGIVDMNDLTVLGSYWLSTDVPSYVDIAPVHVGDGKIDLRDFGALVENWYSSPMITD